MLDEYDTAIETYKTKWEALAKQAKTDFLGGLKPTSVGWKTTDLADFDQRFAKLRDLADHVHLTWLNERWLATFHLRPAYRLAWDMELIILMQRRPDSTDAVGLDHIDFRTPPLTKVAEQLGDEPDVKWTREQNGICNWISIWFNDTEAKLRDHTKLDVAIAELQEISKRMETA